MDFAFLFTYLLSDFFLLISKYYLSILKVMFVWQTAPCTLLFSGSAVTSLSQQKPLGCMPSSRCQEAAEGRQSRWHLTQIRSSFNVYLDFGWLTKYFSEYFKQLAGEHTVGWLLAKHRRQRQGRAPAWSDLLTAHGQRASGPLRCCDHGLQ